MISVVIPLYNKEGSIRKTIESVLNQSFKDFEVIVVNDGSTDLSLNEVNTFYDERIVVVNKQNEGVSSARNSGIRKAKSDYIALLDGDDLWDPGFLQEMVYLIRDFPNASLFGCTWSFTLPDGRNFISDYGIPENFRGYIVNYFEMAVNNALFNSSSVVFSKTSIFELGLFDETLTKGEDVDIWIKYGLTKRIAFLNKPLSFYVLGAENRATKKYISRKECLIWNLERFDSYEETNPSFKRFIDSWRLAHVVNYLKGNKVEVQEITPLLRKVDLSKYPVFWTLMKFLPKHFQLWFYKLRLKYQITLKGINSNISELDRFVIYNN